MNEEPLFSREDLKKLMVPLMLEQTLALSIGLFDTLMVSVCGEAAVSGISLVDSISVLLIQIFAALATGGAVVCSQYIGKQRPEFARKSAGQLLFIITVSSVVMTVLVLLTHTALIRGIFGQIEADVFESARVYFVITALSYPFLGIYNAGAALFRSIGNSKISMYTSLVMNVVNITGNALLIFGFGLGVRGAALATLFSRVLSAAYITRLLCKKDCPLCVLTPGVLKPDRMIIGKILRIGIPSGIENGMFQVGKLLVSGLASTFGTVAIAANAVSNSIASFANIPGSAVGLAMVTVVGRCIGAGEKEQAKYYAGRLMRVAYAGVVSAQFLMALLARPLLPLFHLSPGAISEAMRILLSFAVCAALIWPASFTLPNVLRAAGDAEYTMIVSVFSMWVFRVASCYFFAKVLGMGIISVWVGMYVDWAFRSICYFIRYKHGKWVNHRLV